MLKAFTVFPGEYPADLGCCLVFAESRNKARVLGFREWINLDAEYIDFRAWRVPRMDKHAAELTGPRVFITESDVPEHWGEFFDNEGL